MSAFQSYTGAYEHEGESYSWRCYATTRVYEVRHCEHTPTPPSGRKWASPSQRGGERPVACLVDDTVGEFSQILLQVDPAPTAVVRALRRSDRNVAA